MNTLFILCPVFWPKLPPLGLAYISSFLRHNDIPSGVFDFNVAVYNEVSVEDRMEWYGSSEVLFQDNIFEYLQATHPLFLEKSIQYICNYGADIIAFSVFRSNRQCSITMAQVIKKRCPGVTIVFGGPETLAHKNSGCTVFPVDINEYVDSIVIGEGEQGMLAVIDKKRKQEPCLFLDNINEVDVDNSPFPTFEEFNLSQYVRKRALPIISSRGCIRSCSFCSERLLSKKYRVRSSEHLISEIKRHITEKQIKWFTFHDSLINGHLPMLRSFCEEIIQQDIAIVWEAQAAIRADMDVSLLRLMKQAGCFNLFVGLESGSNGVLRRMNKGYDAETAREFFIKCQDAGLHVEISLIVGFPGETEDEFQESLDFLYSMKGVVPKIAQVNPFVLRQGTTIAQDCNRRGIPYECLKEDETIQMRLKRTIDFFNKNDFLFTPAFIGNLQDE